MGAPAGFFPVFPGVGKLGGWETEVQQRGAEPRCWRHVLKIMHKYIVYWDFRQHKILLVTFAQKPFTTFPSSSASAQLPIAWGHPCNCFLSSKTGNRRKAVSNGQHTLYRRGQLGYMLPYIRDRREEIAAKVLYVIVFYKLFFCAWVIFLRS